MKMDNRANEDLLLSHMEDIELRIEYEYGVPRDIGF